jgi:hypothetical protein
MAAKLAWQQAEKMSGQAKDFIATGFETDSSKRPVLEELWKSADLQPENTVKQGRLVNGRHRMDLAIEGQARKSLEKDVIKLSDALTQMRLEN